MGTVRAPLSEQEEAHVTLILDVFNAAMKEIEQRQQLAVQARDTRFATIRRAHKVPDSVRDVRVIPRKDDQPAFLVYDEPDIMLQDGSTVPDGFREEGSEKSTA